MQISPLGGLVFFVLLLIGRRMGNGFLIGLLLSVPFAATAIGTLTAIGGSSPLIYAVFAACLLVATALRRSFYRDLKTTFREDTTAWVALAMVVYVAAGAIILPRLFAGEATVFQVSRVAEAVAEQLLQPIPLNFTQAAYFILSIMAYFGVRLTLVKNLQSTMLIRGFLAASTTAAALGLIDLGGKLAGLGDVLEPIRTAAYSMMTTDVVGGFYRISGGGSEASSFAGVTMPFLAFCVSHWRATGELRSLILSIILLGLLFLSTSSTAYGGLGILGAGLGASILLNAVRNRIKREDMILIVLGIFGLAVTMCVVLINANFFDTILQVLNDMILNKGSSSSAIERGQWNEKSLAAFATTWGLGIGIGSSRTSSSIVAIITQLGIPGAIMYCAFLFVLLRGLRGRNVDRLSPEAVALARTASATGFGSIVGAAITGSSADTGVLLFVTLAIVCAIRAETKPMLSERFARYIPRLQRA